MKTDIFICTYAKDFPWLKYCLRSIEKFSTGFSVVIGIPRQDADSLVAMMKDEKITVPVVFRVGDEWPGAGMVWHMNQIMNADQWCPSADFIAHMDPDCVFTGPVTPETFFRKGKPVLRFEQFVNIGKRHPGVLKWREATAGCLSFPVLYETMRCHPEVYHQGLYAEARKEIEAKTGMPVAEYIRSCRNEFPQTFCEFVTLGNVAMKIFPHLYHLVEQTGDRVAPPNHLQQFWSHGAMDQPQNIWVNGREKVVVPIEMMTELGLT